MRREPFCNDWYFHFDDSMGQKLLWEEPEPSDWRQVTLPHDWSIEQPRQVGNPSGNSGGYFTMGRGDYRKTIDAPEAWQGKKVFIEFEGVYMNAEIWLDEHFITRHPYGYTSFKVDLTSYLKLGQPNVLKVRVDNAAQLNSRWYSGSGIYRPVWLMVAQPVHIDHWGIYVTTPEISSGAALVRIRTTIVNESGQPAEVSICSRIIDPLGKQVAVHEEKRTIPANSGDEASVEVRVSMPQLWSPDMPDLYRLETEIFQNGQVVDTETTTFGIRSLDFSAEKGFLMNGQPIKLKGGCVHHDNGVLGAASYARSEERKVELHKASGFNAIRCAHNPPAPAFLDACDRLGMLVIDETFDCWRAGKNFYDYHINFDDWWQRDVDAMLLRDRNHPSVIIWSIGNEVQERDKSEGGQIGQMLAERVRSLDPTRPITSAINGSGKDWPATDGLFAALDIGGYNYQWKQYEPDHERFPDRLMIGTESFPLEALQNWAAVEVHPYVLGDFVWTSLDYLGESGIGRVKVDEGEDFLGKYPWHQANCGDMDLCGFKRPQSYYRDILWDVGTQLYIAVYTPNPEGKNRTPTLWGWQDVWPNWNWAGHEGQPIKIDVYSACEETELLLNGRSIGRKPSSRADQHIASFEVPYEPGMLKAVGYENGQVHAETILRTCEPAARICLSADRSQLKAAEGDLAFITVEIVDVNGQVHPAADRLLTISISGVGALAAVGSGNPISDEDYHSSQRTTFHGRCLAVVKSTGETGQAILRVKAEGIEAGELKLNFK